MLKKFMLFVLGLAAFLVLLANLGPMILLGAGLWLLYVIFKKFLRSESLAKKVGWVILALVVAGITVFNFYALIGLAAGYVLYVVYREWKADLGDSVKREDPFSHFEKQWAELRNL